MTEQRRTARREADASRELPNNLEAERSVIGAILIDNKAYDLIAGKLEPPSFFRAAHRKIYAACVHLLDVGALDLVPLVEELIRRGELEDVGGHAYVASMVDGVPRSTNVRYYAEIVKEKAAARALIKLGTKLTDAAYDGEQRAPELIQMIDEQLAQLTLAHGVASGAISTAASMSEMSEGLAKKIERRGQLSGISSGFPKLDLYTHGWQRRKMVVVAAQTSFGKSVFGLQQALAIAAAGERVIYYSLEMSRQDLLWRAWSMLSGIPLSQIMWGNITTPAQFEALAVAQEKLAGLPLEINDSPATSIADMRAECRQTKADRGLGSIVVDYFQRMDVATGDNRAQKLGEVSRRFFDLVGELDLTGFMLSQLTVEGKDATSEPQLEHLRDCKSLGHDADAVLMLHPYKVAEARTDVSVVPMKCLIRKQRGGHLGMVTLDLIRDTVQFSPGEPPEKKATTEPEAPKPAKRKSSPSTW